MAQVSIDIDDSALKAKIERILATAQSREMFATIGRSVVTRVRLCFKLGVDPWGKPWAPLKMRQGQPLRDTGRLANSVTMRADNAGVTIGTNVQYARTHQFGATITPKKGKYLVFPGPGGLIFAKRSVVPRRSFLPIRDPGGVVDLPPAWSVGLVAALRRFFQRELAKE